MDREAWWATVNRVFFFFLILLLFQLVLFLYRDVYIFRKYKSDFIFLLKYII